MKKNRYIPYGYKLEKGEFIVDPKETPTVCRIFNQYARGQTLQGIADELIRSGVPYMDARPCWDKHKIKRMIENMRYTGENDYPPVIEPELFRRVRDMHESKTNNRQLVQDLSDVLWKRLWCGACGGRMLQASSTDAAEEVCHLRCENRKCGNAMDTPIAGLHSEVFGQIQNVLRYETGCGGNKEYQPSADVIMLGNAINRAIENPGDPTDARKLILQGAAARYACCPDVDNGLPAGYDWELFNKRVAYVEIGMDHQIHIRLSS